MSSLESPNKDDLLTATNDDSVIDVDEIEVDDLLNSATRLLEAVFNDRPALVETSPSSPRDDAIQQVQRFLSSIRECAEEEDVVFVEARPGNAPPAGARTTAVVDLCTPTNADDDDTESPNSRVIRSRRVAGLEPIQFPDLNSASPNCSSNLPTKRTRRQPKSEPVDNHTINVSPVRTRRDQTNSNVFTPPSGGRGGGGSGDLPPLTCAICMESVIHRQPCSTSCGHIFCQQCIMQSIRITTKCPLCNTKLTRAKVHRVYF